MAIAVDLGLKATKQTNKDKQKLSKKLLKAWFLELAIYISVIWAHIWVVQTGLHMGSILAGTCIYTMI